MKLKAGIIFIIIFITMAVAAYPDSTAAFNLIDIQNQIENLFQKINQIKKQIQLSEFQTNLYFGMKNNSEVRRLQEFLIKKEYLTPNLNTGNFYFSTLKAVKKYQLNNGISTTGYVGPLTRAKINEEIKISRQALEYSRSQIIEIQKPTPINQINPQPTPEQKSTSSYQIFPKPSYDLKILSFKIHDLINQERNKYGANPLLWNEKLTQTAALHSQDQAKDNIQLTNPDFLCHYPIIRHEGFSFGFYLKDRLLNQGISYHLAGENIALIPTAKNLMYEYSLNNPLADCLDIKKFEPGEETIEERTKLYQEVFNESIKAAFSNLRVKWVNKEWYSAEELAEKAVNGWMNSAGHRENILNPNFISSGIGIAEVNDYLIITQNFIRP